MPKLPWRYKITRDGTLFSVGILGIVHETINTDAASERPYLLGVFCMMVGLPAFFGWDEAKRRSPKSKSTDLESESSDT